MNGPQLWEINQCIAIGVAAAAIVRVHFLATQKYSGLLGEYDARRRDAGRRVRLLVVDNGSELRPAIQTQRQVCESLYF